MNSSTLSKIYFRLKLQKNEDMKTEEKNDHEINDKYIWITEDKGTNKLNSISR